MIKVQQCSCMCRFAFQCSRAGNWITHNSHSNHRCCYYCNCYLSQAVSINSYALFLNHVTLGHNSVTNLSSQPFFTYMYFDGNIMHTTLGLQENKRIIHYSK